jgi:hypothetical protein
LVMIPPGAPHTLANPSDDPTVLLNTSPRICTCRTSGTCGT